MSDERVREAVREATVPEADGAEERAWRVVSAAYEERGRTRARSRHRRVWARPVVAFATLVIAVVVALTPPGEAVGDWIADTLRPAATSSRPVLTSLPTGGRLLVTSRQGPWVVQRDGSKRRLGDYDEVTWSPGGLFVAATSGRQLVALEPDGDVRWTLARRRLVKAPSWSPDGFRIAYLSGEDLRVVAGDGTGDAKVGADPAVVTPAWRPGDEHVLAWASASGRLTVVRTDTGRRVWRKTFRGAPLLSLAWTADGSHLVAVFDGRLEVFSAAGRRGRGIILPTGTRAGSVAMHPAERTLALVRHDPAADRSEAVAVDLDSGRARQLFAGEGRFGDLAWSPDGRWLLLAWRDADQWLFLRSDGVAEVAAVSNVARQFDPGGTSPPPFPGVSGWCCAEPLAP